MESFPMDIYWISSAAWGKVSKIEETESDSNRITEMESKINHQENGQSVETKSEPNRKPVSN